MSSVRILLVDAEPQTRLDLREKLLAREFTVDSAPDRPTLFSCLESEVPDLVVLDGDSLETQLLDLIRDLKLQCEFLPAIVLTSGLDASVVAEGMRRGAFDFLSKPVKTGRLEFSIKSAAHLHRLMVRVNKLQSRYRRRGQYRGLVGISSRMQNVYSIIESLADTNVTVFIMGPSGTGKELIAKAVHESSNRSTERFVAINCAAIPASLLESELFGHEKGAFTGAVNRYAGCCEQSDGGTLFLDEICEIDIDLQSKLLRFLQEKTFYRLGGGKREITVDVRVLAATNRDPWAEVQAGRLREDLYYRLNVVPIEVPALRDRPEDIPPLANLFLERFCSRYGKYFYDYSPEVMQAMLSYDWPGNVRELENLIERIVVLNTGSQVTAQMLPPSLVSGVRQVFTDNGGPAGAPDLILPMRELERQAIARALEICRGNVARASRRLELGQATLYRKIKKFGLALQGSRGQ